MPNTKRLPDLFRSERRAMSPIREMHRMQRRLDRLFNEVLGGNFTGMPRVSREFFPMSEELEFAPACDVEETQNQYVVTFDLPGVKKEDVKVDLHDNQLTVSGERKHEKKENIQGRVNRERFHGTFLRTFTLPTNMNPEKIEAHFDNGVLQIAIPKHEASVGKQIPIKEGKQIENKAKAA